LCFLSAMEQCFHCNAPTACIATCQACVPVGMLRYMVCARCWARPCINCHARLHLEDFAEDSDAESDDITEFSDAWFELRVLELMSLHGTQRNEQAFRDLELRVQHLDEARLRHAVIMFYAELAFS